MVPGRTGVYRPKHARLLPAQLSKSPPIPIPPTRPFLRRQESHSAVHTNIGKSPTIPRPPEDHSCEGRNLIATCRQRRRLLGGGRGMATIRRIVAHDTVRFLPTQEWSVCERECIAKNTPPNVHRRRQISSRRPKCQNRPRFPFPPQTIPAKAGISQCSAYKYRQIPTIPRPPQDHSCEGRNLIATCRQRRRLLCGGRGMATIRRIVAHDTVRFLPTQEWSRGKRECIAKNTPDCCPHNCQNRPRFPFPPQDHSCEGRNLTVQCIQISANPPQSPVPHKTIPAKAGIYFKHVPPTAASLRRTGNGDNSANCGTRHCEIPAYAGMVFRGTEVYRQKIRPQMSTTAAPNAKIAPDSHSPHKTIPAEAGIYF